MEVNYMRHKPMLLSKLAARSNMAARFSIGLLGTHHGSGVTYTGLMLAFYLGEEMGKRTAFIECNRHQDMRLIEEAYEWTSSEKNSFSFRNITCYKELAMEQIPLIYAEEYEALIFDFGIDLSFSINEFLRCDKRVVLAGRTEWELARLKSLHERLKHASGKGSLIYLIRQADNKTIQRLSGELGCTVMSIPFAADPVALTRNIIRFFEALLCC